MPRPAAKVWEAYAGCTRKSPDWGVPSTGADMSAQGAPEASFTSLIAERQFSFEVKDVPCANTSPIDDLKCQDQVPSLDFQYSKRIQWEVL